MAVVADPRHRGALRLHRDDVVLAGHRGVAGGEGPAVPPAAGHRDRTAAVHLRPADQPGPTQPEPALPAARHHQPARGVRAGPGRAGRALPLDHLATRVRRNAENLLVLSGEQPPRTWSEPVPLRDVLRAAIAETEDLTAVVFVVDEQTGGRRARGHRPDPPARRADRERGAVLAAGHVRSPSARGLTGRNAGGVAAHRGGLGRRHAARRAGRGQRPAGRAARAGPLGLAAAGLPRRRAARGPARDQLSCCRPPRARV